jgi:branched-chain amino acid transport system substrate-binding protein
MNQKLYLILCAAALSVSLSVSGVIYAADPIKIGICKPFTGPVGYLGQDQKPGYEMALEEINSAGGVLGRPLKLIYADNQCNPTEGVNAIRKLIDLDKVVATIAGACSSVTLAIMPVIQEAKVPNLTISSSNPRITQLAGVGGNIWEFRLNVDDSIMAKSLGKIIAEKNKKVVIYAPNNDYGRGAVQAYTEVFKILKVDLQSTEFYDQGQADYRPSLTKVKGLNPDALLLVSESRDAAVLVRQMKESGFRPRLYARGSVVTTEFAKAIKDDCSLGEGTVEATLTAYGVYPEWDKNFEKKFGMKPHLGAPQGYTGLKVMAKAIELGGKAEPEAIRQGLKKINITDKIMGPIQFDDHNQAHTWMTITTMKNCQVQLLQVVPTDK